MRFMWVSLLTTKSATADAIKRTQAEAEKVCGRKLNVLRTDNGREFTAGEFADYTAPTRASHITTLLPTRLSRMA